MCHNLISDLELNDYIIDYAGKMFKVNDKRIVADGSEVVLALEEVTKAKRPNTLERGFYLSGRWFTSLYEEKNHPRDIKEIIKGSEVSYGF
jgi:hypothetical protein